MAKINLLKFELLREAPCLADLVPADYFLVLILRKWVDGKRFVNNEEVKSVVDVYFEKLDGLTINRV